MFVLTIQAPFQLDILSFVLTIDIQQKRKEKQKTLYFYDQNKFISIKIFNVFMIKKYDQFK